MKTESQYVQRCHRLSKTFWLSVITAVGIFIINTLGFTDTITGSALGCGRDWPLCNGQAFPSTWNMATFIEYTHRVSVLVGGVLLIWLAIVAWKKYSRSKSVRSLVLVSLGGVLAEGALGALAVIFVNPPAVMAAHLGIALISFVAVVLLTDVIRKMDMGEQVPASLPGNGATSKIRPMPSGIRGAGELKNLSRLAWLSIPYGYLAIYIGAYVANTGYGAFFQGWPVPTESVAAVGPAFWIDILHRTVALGYLVWMGCLVAMSYRFRRMRRSYFVASYVAFVFVCLQAATGAMLIETHLSTIAFLLHVTNVTLLFTTQCYLGFTLLSDRVRNQNVHLQRKPDCIRDELASSGKSSTSVS